MTTTRANTATAPRTAVHTTTAPLDTTRSAHAFRARFPMLERTTHLAACSLGARSLDLDCALAAMLDAMGRRGAPWPQFEAQAETARHHFAELVGASSDEIAILPDASTAAYQVASTFDWAGRPRLVTTAADFPSMRVRLQSTACA